MNEEVLEMVKETRTMMSRRRQVRFLGHISREKGLEKVCLEGKLEKIKEEEASAKLHERTNAGDRNGFFYTAAQSPKSEWFQETGLQRQSLTRYTKKKRNTKAQRTLYII